MLTIYAVEGQTLVRQGGADGDAGGAVWIDLVNPSGEEERAIEKLVGLQVPTREEMSEIEVSSRLYQEKGAHFMTATILYHVDLPDPQATAITFILAEKQLITVRYAEPRSFQLFLTRAQKGDIVCSTPMAVLLGLLETIIDREADLVERLQSETEKLAQVIFDIRGGSRTRTARFDVILRQIGRVGEITSRLRESLLSLGRLLTYLYQIAQQRNEPDALRQRIRTEDKDVQSLSDHASYLNARITFMLDASLGMVSIEQNQIIKLFSVVAVILLPPTLIASIYGMNFHHMPELDWVWGYPMALGLMVLSALLPYLYFRRKGWL
ncbi:MAG TPA: magnesium/cobalt transporter CorA [Hyphomicrobiaceae bacterium]|nr:magnesium/cobalt transporter CorA [Hyphomicrobiaceae bacterium]